MWPLGSYERMVHEIKRRENPDIPITFGILIADYRQSLNQEYILNYINRFDYKSDRYINFYLPGYIDDDRYGSNQEICINDKKYYFNLNEYEKFLIYLENDFKIEYPYTPILLLVEYKNGHFSKSNIVRIELDSDPINIKRTGILFEKIFLCAQSHVNIDDIQKGLRKTAFKEGLLENIVQALDISWLTAIQSMSENVKSYKIS
ncbi:hypothetical protein [Clostridium butyricum]|uniref:hypothetical protein n=1 Tax=Clostridium butyricum TaxID=1492 RepID=UPI002ABE4609|nr:hypothetical protein [Clostridium butyricum]